MPQPTQKRKAEAEATVSKKAKTDQHDDDQQLDETFQKLSDVVDGLDEIELDYNKEFLQLLSKYEAKKAPLYNQRRELLKKIPNFWSIIISAHPAFGGLVSENDLSAIEALEDLTVERDPSCAANFTIGMHFGKNDTFENKKISANVTFKDGDMETIECSPIKWKGKLSDEEKSESVFNMFEEKELDYLNLIANDLFPKALTYYQEMNEDDSDAEEDLLSDEE
ncbi:hypothetical protein BKA69DRAFT_1097548 [Paraphysoderma sedebokerense]|nr:hypothetical protein BKA69DRAFT_1100895 [Paraphysoderma sedebokerense]KAI9137539.1 hypothetical protein BKA69DRAFT_1097523 [Paraphysoderma sedebokerense]KAI9137543.1 hypothetical protein BKA69DRAFT_1097548 [Paraphysoderma sedebokerense]